MSIGVVHTLVWTFSSCGVTCLFGKAMREKRNRTICSRVWICNTPDCAPGVESTTAPLRQVPCNA